MSRYRLTEHRAAMGRLTREPEACECTPRNPRHDTPRACISKAELAAWRAKNPEFKGPDEKARVWCWLEREFGGEFNHE